jgi:hypothetical protein
VSADSVLRADFARREFNLALRIDGCTYSRMPARPEYRDGLFGAACRERPRFGRTHESGGLGCAVAGMS